MFDFLRQGHLFLNNLLIRPDDTKPSVAAGKISFTTDVAPLAGKSFMLNENNKIDNNPSQKIGIETPINDIVIKVLSIHVSLYSAARNPVDIPTTIATSSPRKLILSVYGNFSKHISTTGILYLIDSPKSPCRALITKSAYCI